MMKNNNKRFKYSLILSVVLHAALAMFLWLRPQLSLRDVVHGRKPVEVELMDPDKMAALMKKIEKNGQIVTQDQRINDEKPKDTNLLSKFDQTVVHQTQAELHDKFKNTTTTGGPQTEKKIASLSQKKVMESAPKEVETLTSNDGPEAKHTKPALKDLMPSFRPTHTLAEAKAQAAQGGGEGPSASDDHLKNVPVGMQTLLSTREFVYYSYYNRIKEKLRQYWEPKIKEKVARILRQGRQIASTGDKITRIVIILDEKGILRRVQIVGASGVSDLDDAAVEAFRLAAPFPNPPKGIVEADGTIKIHWDFILEANSGLFDGVGVASKIM
jgi:TonB family protein